MSNIFWMQHMGQDEDYNYLESNIGFSKLDQFLPPELVTEFREKYKDIEKVWAWGIRKDPINEKSWTKIEKGDVILFIQGQYIENVGIIMGKIVSKDLARTIWGNKEDGDYRELIYFINSFDTINAIPLDEFNEEIGAGNNKWRRFSALTSEQRQIVIDKYFRTGL